MSSILIINSLQEDFKGHIDDGSMGGGGPITHSDSTTENEWNGDAHAVNNPPDLNGNHLYGNYFTDERQRIFWHCVIVHDYTEAKGQQVFDSLIISDTDVNDKNSGMAKVFMHELGHAIGAWIGGQPGPDGWHNPDKTKSVMYKYAEDATLIDYDPREWNNLRLINILNPPRG